MTVTFLPALPEIILAVGALVLVLIGAIGGDRMRTLIEALAVVLLLVVGALVISHGGRNLAFHGAFIDDHFARFMKGLTIIGSIAAILMSVEWMKRAGVERYEYAILVVLATLGMLLMISANDLISLYLGLELQSLALYVLAAIHRDDDKASEAGLKYFVLGALSSGMFLYGASLVYGFSGSTSFAGIAQAVSAGHGSTGVIVGLVFVLAGLSFKISAVPFHMWTPDVYEGAPTPIAAFFAAASKMAAMAMTVRVVMTAFPGIAAQWQQVVIFVSIASMVLGALAAIGQSNLKRLMAYSSIANMGFALVGLSAGSKAGVEGVALFMGIYLAMTLGVFACIMALQRDGKSYETIEDLSGLSRTHPAMAFALLLFMFSLIGIPGLAGFWAKYAVFAGAIEAKLYVLAVIGMLASVVAAFYYLRIVKVMYLDEAKPHFDAAPTGVKAVIMASAVFVVVIGLYPAPLLKAAGVAARSLF